MSKPSTSTQSVIPSVAVASATTNTIPSVSQVLLKHRGAYVAESTFRVWDPKTSSYKETGKWTGRQYDPQNYRFSPGDYGVKQGDQFQLYVWVEAGNDMSSGAVYKYDDVSEEEASFSCNGTTLSNNLFHNDDEFLVSKADIHSAKTVGENICHAIQKNRARGADNPVLNALALDPLTVLIENGLPKNYFDNASGNDKTAYLKYLKTEAQKEMKSAQKDTVKRGFFACWACRIGFGAILAVAGVAITVATAGATGPLYALCCSYMIMSAGMTLATASAVMTAAAAGGGTILAGGLGALIEYICESIPGTC